MLKKRLNLGHFFKNCANVGYGKTRKDVMRIAESVAKENGVLKKLDGGDGFLCVEIYHRVGRLYMLG